MNEKEIYIKVTKDGPYMVYGAVEISQKIILTDGKDMPIKYGDGKVFEIKSGTVALCRCGKSKNSPYCDGAHAAENFDGKETASFEPVLKDAIKYEGPNYTLMDNEKLCSLARFCDAEGTIWNLISKGEDDTDALAINQANLCSSGRLIIFDKNGNMVEESLPQSIVVLEDDGLKISGPLWIRGGIRVESESGQSYEIRNRQTLCRCGKSENKPFCDCTHAYINFHAEYKLDD